MAERDFLKNRIKELDMLAYGRDIIKNTDFLDIREQSVYLSMKNELSARSFLYGGHEDADRRMAIFLPASSPWISAVGWPSFSPHIWIPNTRRLPLRAALALSRQSLFPSGFQMSFHIGISLGPS